MKFLKGLALSFLSLILFLSLSLFGTTFVLNQTLLNPAFVGKELDSLNISQFAREIAPQLMQGFQISGLPPGIDQKLVNDALVSVASSAIARYEPELKSQAKAAVTSAYSYLFGKTDSISISFNLTAIKSTFKDTLRQSILAEINKLPPIPGFPPETLRQLIFDPMVDDLYQQYAAQVPDTYTFDEITIPPDALSQIKQVKTFVGYYQFISKALIAVIIVCVLLIVLIEHNLKGTTRSLGLNLLFFGGVGYAIDYVFNRFAPNYIDSLLNQMAPPGTIPPSIQTWVMKLMDDAAAPLQRLSIAIIAVGAVLFIISFFLKSPEPKSET